MPREGRGLKKLGARTTNKSAAMDYRAVLEQINDMVSPDPFVTLNIC